MPLLGGGKREEREGPTGSVRSSLRVLGFLATGAGRNVSTALWSLVRRAIIMAGKTDSGLGHLGAHDWAVYALERLFLDLAGPQPGAWLGGGRREAAAAMSGHILGNILPRFYFKPTCSAALV
jgi:hypothetical protein